MASIELIRGPNACPKCYGIHSRNDGPGMAKVPPEHLKAICWAYICDECARILLEAVGCADPR